MHVIAVVLDVKRFLVEKGADYKYIIGFAIWVIPHRETGTTSGMR